MFPGLAPARRRLILAVLVFLAVAVLAGSMLLIRRGSENATPTDQQRPGPVLLVPGYGGSTASLSELAARLTAAGRDATVVPLPGNGTGDLTVAARTLGDTVHTVLSRTRAASVDLVGYSAGGIVVRLWVADDGGAGLARRVVTLGSPHHGTSLADLATELAAGSCPAACRQLATDSDLLRKLNAGDETPEGPTWVSIWTTGDQTVTPPDSARLAGALNVPVQSVCATAQVSHSDLPRNPLVQAMVLTELAAGAPVPLTPADCTRLEP